MDKEFILSLYCMHLSLGTRNSMLDGFDMSYASCSSDQPAHIEYYTYIWGFKDVVPYIASKSTQKYVGEVIEQIIGFSNERNI